MFVEVVTLVTLAIFWGRFEAVFLTTEAPGIGAEVGGQRVQYKRCSPGRGVFKRDKRDKRDKSIKTGFFAFWKRDK